METVFLEDGRQANLITKTDKGYVVDPISKYEDYESGEEYDEPSGNVLQVAKVFKVAPLDVINAEYKEVLDRISAQEDALAQKRQEFRDLEYKIKNLTTDLSRYIINREELRLAKRLILFGKDCIAPKIMDGTKSRKFTVSYEISQYKEEERCWEYELWQENKESGSWSSSNYFDPEYGIMVDLTDEQIKEKTFERQNKRGIKGFYSNQIMGTGDEWLTTEFQVEKKRLIEKSKVDDLVKAEDELKKAQERYNKLTGKTVPEAL